MTTIQSIPILLFLLGAGCRVTESAALHQAEPTEDATPEIAAPTENATGAILASWVKAHNSRDEDALADWIESTYSPDLLERVNMEDHIAFYWQIVEEFGALYPDPILEAESTPLRRVVYMRPLDIIQPDPTNTLVVEIDLDAKDPHYLKGSLGLGALICEDKKP